MTLLDLTHVLHPGIPLGGPLPQVEVRQLWTLGPEIANISYCGFATHCGTHIDAPNHFIPDARRLPDIPLDWLCGPASFVELACAEHQAIEGDVLERYGAHVRAADRLFLRTGFSDRYDDQSYHQHPYLADSAIDWILERGVRLIALDTLTPERPRSLRIEGEAFGCPAHHRLLEAEVLIVENARLSADIPERGDVSILPLALAVGDGAPVRIVVKLPEPSRVL